MESYFQEALADFIESAIDLSWATERTFILFKPDAGAARCVEAAIAALESAGFEPIFAEGLRLNRHSARELWRYELNTSTLDRYPALDALVCGRPSLVVALRRRTGAQSVHHASATLTAFKGPSSLNRRDPGHLRTRIDSRDGMLNLIHTPDETLDMIREFGVLFPRQRRRRLIARLAAGHAAPASELAARTQAFYAAGPPHSLRLDEVRTRLGGGPELEALLREGRTADDFAAYRRRFRKLLPESEDWDVLTAFVAHRDCETAGVARLIPA